jgi:hypothetical protein
MSESDEKREGLTKPLVNNIGGVIDQDAPSADQLLEGADDPSWDNVPVRKDGSTIHREHDDGFIPSGADRVTTPGDISERRFANSGPVGDM